MINVELMKKWIAALRSGYYKQGKSSLYSNGKYCCLGVLCSIVDAQTLDVFGDNLFLPANICDKIGPIKQVPLAELNDVKGLNFSEIADYLEERYLEH